MPPGSDLPYPAILASIILAVHVAIILFNIVWLIAIPLGAWQRWRFVRNVWLRAAHLVAMAIVAGQAALGRACFLTLWQDRLTGTQAEPPLVMRWINGLIYWPLPLWVFAIGYIVLFLYVVILLIAVPPNRPFRPA